MGNNIDFEAWKAFSSNSLILQERQSTALVRIAAALEELNRTNAKSKSAVIFAVDEVFNFIQRKKQAAKAGMEENLEFGAIRNAIESFKRNFL